MESLPNANLFVLEQKVGMLCKNIGVPVYDFDFTRYFHCRHLWQKPDKLSAVARIGVIRDYPKLWEALQVDGVHLIHTPQQYQLCSDLTYWYLEIADLTARSVWFWEQPAISKVEAEFMWPIFMRSARQTSGHKVATSIIDGPEAFRSAWKIYEEQGLTGWQPIVCREYLPLRPAGSTLPGIVPSAFEFRTFWWKGKLVGDGHYWHHGAKYTWNASERLAGLQIASEAAKRLAVPFVVIDLAQTQLGQWVVIECNDAQESSYAGISPLTLWQNILAVETSI